MGAACHAADTQKTHTQPSISQLEECKKNFTWIMQRKNASAESPTTSTITFQRGDMIGSGLFGTVYQGLSATGQIVAIKCIPTPEPLHTKKEISALRSLVHPNIVKYIDAVYQKDSLDVLTEYAPAGSIKTVIENFGALNEKVAQVYTKQILNGLSFLHSKGIVHKNLKAANVLVDNEAIVKLTDFGFSNAFIKKLKTIKENAPMWLPPEHFKEESEPKETFDIWSLGILVLEILTGKEFRWEFTPLDPLSTEKSVLSILPSTLSVNCKLFVQSCLKHNPHQRATLSELLGHPFLGASRTLEKEATLKQIRYQINSLSISGSQHIKKFSKASVPEIIYSINSVYLSGLGSVLAENSLAEKTEKKSQQNIRFSSSVESSGSMEPTMKSPVNTQKREEIMELERQLLKEKEAMKKLLEGYSNIG